MLSDVWSDDFDWELPTEYLSLISPVKGSTETDTTDTTDVTSSSDTNSDNSKRLKRSRNVSSVVPRSKRRRDVVPRVLFQDIRKSYHKMWFNCLNSGDLALMYGFLDTFSIPETQMTVTRFGTNYQDQLYRMKVLGLEEMVKYWYCVASLSPDYVLQLNDTTVQHTTGWVTTKLHKESTLIYEDIPNNPNYWAPYILIEEQYSDICPFDRDYAIGKSQSVDVSMLDKKQTMRDIMRSIDYVVSRLRLRTVPAPMCIDGECTITTDEFNRIVKIECSAVVSM